MAFEKHIEEEDLAGYSLGALSPEEARRVEEHLAACGTCRLTADEFADVADLLPYSAAPVSPPPALERRVLAAIDQERRAAARRLPAWAPWAAAAALVVVVGAGGLTARAWLRPGPVAVVKTEMMQLKGTTLAPAATARLTVMETRSGVKKLVLEADGLPQLHGSAIYTMWLLRDGRRWNCGSFAVDKSGHGMLAYDWDSEYFDQVGVTMEPQPNSTNQPMGQKVLGMVT